MKLVLGTEVGLSPGDFVLDGHPELIMRDRVKCLLEVHEAHIEWLLMLACLVHQYP